MYRGLSSAENILVGRGGVGCFSCGIRERLGPLILCRRAGHWFLYSTAGPRPSNANPEAVPVDVAPHT